MRFILILSIALTSCTGSAGRENPDICVKPARADGDDDFLQCVHFEGYQLARSKESAKLVAEAVVANCVPQIQAYVEKQPEEKQNKMYSEIYETLEGFALHSVIQARAGLCDVPPRNRN